MGHLRLAAHASRPIMIRIVQDPRTGIYYRVAVDPATGRTRVLGPALESQVEPGVSGAMAEYLQTTLPDADIAGFRGPGVVPGGEQVRKNDRARELNDSLVIPETYRPLAGAGQVNRGRTIDVTIGAAAIQLFESVVETQPTTGDDAEIITLTLGMRYGAELRASSTNDQIAVTSDALLTWGIGGASFTAEVDWQQGVVFSVAASFARVGLRVTAPLALSTQVLSYMAGLSYGSYSRGFASPIRKTVAVGDLAAAASIAVRIPRFAQSFTIVSGTTGAAAPALEAVVVQDNVPNVLATFNVTNRTNTAQQHEGQFPIPNGGRLIELTNNAAVLATNIHVIFYLAL